MFNLLAAKDVCERMDALEDFLKFWYGPHRPEFGEPEDRLRVLPLPYPLQRFYAFAGRWPSPRTEDPEGWFYRGASIHHLFPLDSLEVMPGGLLRFSMEYQGDWTGFTLLDEEDPPVWIDEVRKSLREETGSQSKPVAESLSRFLVSHCLLATVYDEDNYLSSRDSVAWCRAPGSDACWIWDTRKSDYPRFEGRFFLFLGSILVYKGRNSRYRFATNDPERVL
jgi:hypothetical protein